MLMCERRKYLGLMFSRLGVAVALGPLVRGALAQSSWLGIFYINLPICGVVFVGPVVLM